jgi:hypothetical protein
MGLRLPAPNDLVRDCLGLLALRGVRAWRNNTGAGGTEGRFLRFGAGAGGPDILAILPPSGRLLGVECKTDSGRLAPAQRAWHEAARAAGAAVLVVRSIDELDHHLRELSCPPTP